ncbi:hypothetical protein AHA_3595 [Aeromonas hydrophila subsp. hydrophila ATCC 7966]|uniref:Uncharacterized protein n=1 Tax=Aeromonas hydrophila subsp. hydrophila (strain ATCC 7966 / DSM 30187 / BCRC 13018 / CCUG 14551 / JCM 1027 / KCTC 2358 / NCIMB 9240 / NCTC 8049) TaxID=380703 RepID=A0KP65_AERHH|nr:hypothetical protein AHA_3595 [Aeromonas hydrophila subsp. hydrophila ATCC 7966]
MVEASLQPIHQQGHPGGGHAGRPAQLQQLQQLPGIAGQGGELLLQGQRILHGQLVLARRAGPLPLLAQVGQPQLAPLQLFHEIADDLLEQLLHQRGRGDPGLILAELAQVALGVVGQAAELADGKAEQLVEVVIPCALRWVLGEQYQGLVEAVVQAQHQRLEQGLLVGPQGHRLAEVAILLLQGTDPGGARVVPEHRQAGIEDEVIDGHPEFVIAEEAQAEGVGLLQRLALVLEQQRQQNGRLAPLRLPGLLLQQQGEHVPGSFPLPLVQQTGQRQFQLQGGWQPFPVAGQILARTFQFVQPQQSVDQPLARPPGIVLRGADRVVLGGVKVILLLQQHVALDPVQQRPQLPVLLLLIEQVLAQGAADLPLPELHRGGQGAGQPGQLHQFAQTGGELIGGERHGQQQRKVEVGRGKLQLIVILVQQQQHAARFEQTQIVGLLQQAHPLTGLMVVLAADDHIERLLAQQGRQGRQLLAVGQLGRGDPLLIQSSGEGRAEHGIIFDQEDLHPWRSLAGSGYGQVWHVAGVKELPRSTPAWGRSIPPRR